MIKFAEPETRILASEDDYKLRFGGFIGKIKSLAVIGPGAVAITYRSHFILLFLVNFLISIKCYRLYGRFRN